MERRTFLVIALLLATIPIFKDDKTNSWDIIKATLEDLFPKYNQFSGAEDLDLINFFKSVTDDQYFDKEDLNILVDGAKKLYTKNRDFITLSSKEREDVLRIFEQTKEGQIWLSKLINYGFEGMLGDPIYGGNKNALGWKAISHNSGLPRPKVKYGI